MTEVVELTSSDQEFCARRSDGAVVCWGNRFHARGPKEPLPARVSLALPARSLAGGNCATLTDGSLWCWSGAGEWDVPEPSVRTPRRIDGYDVTGPVAVGSDGLCAVTGAPTRVRCRGYFGIDRFLGRYSGEEPEQIYRPAGSWFEYVPGPGEPAVRITSAQLPPWWPEGPPLERVQGILQLETLANFFCLRTAEATRCFTRDEVEVPEAVRGWRYLSGSGSEAMCGIDAAGRVGVWYPALDFEEVTYVEGVEDATQVDCVAHGCLVHADQSVSCFGLARTVHSARYPAPLRVNQPTRIAGVSHVLEVAAGGSGAACARHEDQTVSCWGDNDGSLGIGAPLPPGNDVPVYPPRLVRAPH